MRTTNKPKALLVTAFGILGMMQALRAEAVHMGFWNGNWNVVRKQQTSSAYQTFRNPEQWIIHTPNVVDAIQAAVDVLPPSPSGGASENLIYVRNFTGAPVDVWVDGFQRKKVVIRNRHQLRVDFDWNVFNLRGGTGDFFDVHGVWGLVISNVTVNSLPNHTGSTVFWVRQCDSARLENINVHRNGEGGIGIRVEGNIGARYMHDTVLAGNFNFSGGRWDKWGIKAWTIQNLSVGAVAAWWCPGSAICINDTNQSSVRQVYGYALSQSYDHAYGALRYANNCVGWHHVGDVVGDQCGRALATVSSPSLNLVVNNLQSYNSFEYGANLTCGYARINSGWIFGNTRKSGVAVAGGSKADLSRLWIQDIHGTGVSMDGYSSSVADCGVHNCGGFGVRVSGNGNRVLRVGISGAGNSGLRIDGQGNYIEGCWIGWNRNHGIRLMGSSWNTVMRYSTGENNAWGSSNGSPNLNIAGCNIDWR